MVIENCAGLLYDICVGCKTPKTIYIEGGLHMAYIINDTCISCGACPPECPVDCISEGDSKYVIDPDVCISCGACAPVCPVDCIEAG